MLTPGTRLGPYQIEARVGTGGMGEVYRGRDTRLGRTIAVKVIQGELAQDEHWRERFEAEARAISSLNHPHVCTLHDVGHDAGVHYLVMEFVEGAPIAGPLPPAKLLQYGIQITRALEAAHRSGIVHRDLKPGNVLVTKSGTVKLLDFGLARLTAAPAEVDVTQPLTGSGFIAGTPQYMAPEQLEGKPADARSDIFALGLVLYEMATGQPAFTGTSPASVMASILKEQPRPARELQPDVPPALERLIAACLEKDPDERWQSARDVRRELEWIAGGAKEQAALPRSTSVWRSLAVGLLVVAAGLAIASLLKPPPATVPEPMPLTALPGDESQPALSPDGKLVAFVWSGPDYRSSMICVKQLDASEPLILTKDQRDAAPAWSPDGRQIAFVRDRSSLMIVPALGGAARVVASLPMLDKAVMWMRDDRILVAGSANDSGRGTDIRYSGAKYGLVEVVISNGEVRTWTSPPTDQHDAVMKLSPNGRVVAFVRTMAITAAPSQLFTLDVDERGAKTTEPRRVAAQLIGITGFDWAPDGKSLIVAATRGGTSRLVRVDPRTGDTTPYLAGASGVTDVGIAHSTGRLAYSEFRWDIDVWRLPGPAWPAGEARPRPQRFIASSHDDVSPTYSQDGTRVYFESRRTGHQEIWSVDAEGGGAVQLTTFEGPAVGSPAVSPDGRWIAFDGRRFGDGDIFVVPANGGEARRLTTDASAERLPAWSPDGRWIYFDSNRTGQSEVYKIPSGGGEWVKLGTGFGYRPVPAGPWVYYWGADSALWRVGEGGKPERAMDAPAAVAFWQDKAIFFVDATKTVSMQDVPGGKVTLLHDVSGLVASPRRIRIATLAVSPNGKWILVSLSALDRGDLMTVEKVE